MTRNHFHSNGVIAHRGAWKALALPENSIASLKQAILLGCAGSEFDVHMTSDNELVIHHDAIFNGLDIETHTLEALRKLPLSNGEPMPTLSSYLLEGMKKNTGTRLIVEIKPSSISQERGIRIVKKVYDTIKALKASPWVVYISFDIEILKALIALNPNVKTQYLNGELSPAQLKKLGITGLDYHYSVYRNHQDWIREARELNMALNVWTVNTEADMDYFIQHAFGDITTNEPEILFKKIKEKSIRN